MTDTQWLMELQSIHIADERKMEEFVSVADLIKKGVINILGLNLMPISEELSEEEKLAFEKAGASTDESYRLRLPRDDEFLPLTVLVGNPELLSEIIKRREELHNQDNLEPSKKLSNISPDEMDKLVKQDLDVPEFIDPKDFGKYIKNESVKKSMKGVVESRDEIDFDDESIFVKSNRLPKEPKTNKKISLEY